MNTPGLAILWGAWSSGVGPGHHGRQSTNAEPLGKPNFLISSTLPHYSADAFLFYFVTGLHAYHIAYSVSEEPWRHF